jgi:hypothetical protein
MKSKHGFMVGYDAYDSGYLIWYPGSHCLEKVCDIVFHEDVITPAQPILYGDEDGAIMPKEKPDLMQSTQVPQTTTAENRRLTIRILPRPKLTHSKPEEPSHLVSNVPDFPCGTMRSGR